MLKKLVAMVFAMALLTGVLGGSVAYAHTGHGSCKGYGEAASRIAQNNVPSGELRSFEAKLGLRAERTEARHGGFCEPA